MKVTILVENLKKAVSVGIRGVSSKAQLPILGMLMLEVDKKGMSVSSTDLEMSFWVKVGAKVEEEGSTLVPAKLFFDLVSTLPTGVVNIVSEKEKVEIFGDKLNVAVMGQEAVDFPSLPRSLGGGLEIKMPIFRKAMETVMISVARDDTRPVLTGVLWEFEEDRLIWVTTDGYRLGVLEEGMEMPKALIGKKYILPARAVTEILRVMGEGTAAFKIEFDEDKQQVIFSDGDVEVSSRLLAGDFPPYRQVMPSVSNFHLEVERDSLLEAVKRAQLFAKDNANIVRLSLKKGVLEVEAQSGQTGAAKTALEINYDGGELIMAFNAKYLLDYLGSVGQEVVAMETEGELKPVVFYESNLGKHVIMPVRVSN